MYEGTHIEKFACISFQSQALIRLKSQHLLVSSLLCIQLRNFSVSVSILLQCFHWILHHILFYISVNILKAKNKLLYIQIFVRSWVRVHIMYFRTCYTDYLRVPFFFHASFYSSTTCIFPARFSPNLLVIHVRNEIYSFISTPVLGRLQTSFFMSSFIFLKIIFFSSFLILFDKYSNGRWLCSFIFFFHFFSFLFSFFFYYFWLLLSSCLNKYNN